MLSNYCNKCKIAEGLPDDPEWKEKHKANCPKNFDGTSNAMEVEYAECLWKRSVEKNKYRYTTMLSDGDSKAYDAVIALRPYGDNVLLFKEDSINDVAKRMGTALRTIVATAKAQKELISGKGKLTDMKIKRVKSAMEEPSKITHLILMFYKRELWLYCCTFPLLIRLQSMHIVLLGRHHGAFGIDQSQNIWFQGPIQSMKHCL